jgi:hypothetical protein
MDEFQGMTPPNRRLRPGIDYPDPDDPRPPQDIEAVGRMYDGRTVVRFHRGDGRYMLGVIQEQEICKRV